MRIVVHGQQAFGKAVLEALRKRGDDVIAVLVVGWQRDVRELTPREGSMVTLLADEAAVAIERSDMIAQLAALARTDPLTGLPNRRVWEERTRLEESPPWLFRLNPNGAGQVCRTRPRQLECLLSRPLLGSRLVFRLQW